MGQLRSGVNIRGKRGGGGGGGNEGLKEKNGLRCRLDGTRTLSEEEILIIAKHRDRRVGRSRAEKRMKEIVNIYNINLRLSYLHHDRFVSTVLQPLSSGETFASLRPKCISCAFYLWSYFEALQSARNIFLRGDMYRKAHACC